MSATETERKVQQLDNDVQAIYTLLGTIDGTLRRHHNRLEELSSSMTRVSARLDSIETRLDKVDTRLDGVDTKLDRIVDLLAPS